MITEAKRIIEEEGPKATIDVACGETCLTARAVRSQFGLEEVSASYQTVAGYPTPQPKGGLDLPTYVGVPAVYALWDRNVSREDRFQSVKDLLVLLKGMKAEEKEAGRNA
jgi:hypothetical protein